nr:reverse transcriptase domain-containing protein [Tanacetum cinerariifolium]
MTPEAVQTMIDQALLRNFNGGDGSHSSHTENPRNMHTARPCYYANFMKCHPLNFKGTEGAFGLTCWIEKMESVFNISGTLGLDAYTMTWSVLKKKMTDKSSVPMWKENLIARERRMTSPKTTSNLSRGRMSQKRTTWDLLRKRTMREMRRKRNGNVAGNPDSNVVTDLMPVELGSFDAIIGMDWLRRHHVVIVCDEKLVRVPFGNETLVFRGAKSYIERDSRLTVISCSKVQEYRAKGCHVFLAQISATK